MLAQKVDGNYSGYVRDLLAQGKPEHAAVAYIAIVCYPFDQKQTDAFIHSQTAYVAKRLRDTREIYVADDARTMKAEKMMARLVKTEKILFEGRLNVAVNIAMPVLLERYSPHSSGLRIHGAPSVYQASKNLVYFSDRRANTKASRKNLINREWLETRPVLHLAYAMANRVNWCHRDRDGRRIVGVKDIQPLIWSPEWVAPALKDAPHILDALISANVIRADEQVVQLAA